MHCPKISVIVPVYNVEKYLHRCIDSILSQTFTDFELLLINDGSKDESGKICDEYAGKDVRVRVFHKKNGGVSSARNMGLDNAKGEWVTFCDADDYVGCNWLRNFGIGENLPFQMMCQGIITSRPLDKDASDNGPVGIGFNYAGSIQVGLEKLLLLRILGYVFNKAFRLDLILERCVRFDENVRYREDEKFILEYVRNNDCMLSNSNKGYTYTVPDFGKKYGKHIPIELCRNQYYNTKRLCFADESVFLVWFTNEYKNRLLTEYKNGNNNRLDILYELRELIAENRKIVRMHPLLKALIEYDRTNILCRAFLSVYFLYKTL